MTDFVKIYSQLLDWGWFHDSECVHLLMYLSLKARTKDGMFNGEKIYRGEAVAGRGSISAATGISVQSVRTRMYWMVGTEDISIRQIGKYGVIKVTNYEKFQTEIVPKAKKETAYMKNKKELMKKPYTEDFIEWFAVYMKGNKRTAWLRWQQLIDKMPQLSELIEITKTYIEYCNSIDRTRMDAEGWLNQHFFESVWTHEAQGTGAPESKEKDHLKGYNL